METLLELAARAGIVMFEAIAVLIMVGNGIAALVLYLRKKPHVVLFLTRAMNFALMFKLCGEILRMQFIRSFEEIGIVGCIILIHGAISFLIHWEIRQEETHHNNKDSDKELSDINL